MRRGLRSIVGLVSMSLIVTTLVGCSFMGSTTTTNPEQELSFKQKNTRAITNYVQTERVELQKIIEENLDVYLNGKITWAFEESNGDGDIPAGTFARIQTDFIFAEPMDWSFISKSLDKEFSDWDKKCQSEFFPRIRDFGILGPVSLVFTYTDIDNQFDIKWQYECIDV